MRVVAVAVLLEQLKCQRSIDERPYQIFERQMHGTDPRPQTIGRHSRRLVKATRLAVAKMQDGYPFGPDEAGMRTDEAGMEPGIDEGTARSENAGSLTDEAWEIIDVCVRKHGHDSVEVRTWKGKRRGVRLDELGACPRTFPRKTKLVRRNVDARGSPAEGEQPRQVQTGAAAEVEAAARPRTEQSVDDVTRGQSEFRKVLVVPGGEPVIPRGSPHAAMMPLDWNAPRVTSPQRSTVISIEPLGTISLNRVASFPRQMVRQSSEQPAATW
jgi:hypothetical protein